MYACVVEFRYRCYVLCLNTLKLCSNLILEWKRIVLSFGGSLARSMGIKGLAQVIGDFAAGAIKDQDIKAFFGRYIYTYIYTNEEVECFQI